MEFLRQNKLAAVVIVVLLFVWRSWGYTTYSERRCVNETSDSWTQYRLVECSIYHLVPEDERILPEEGEVAIDPMIHLEFVPGAHVSTFEEINESYARDKRNVYFGTEKVSRAHPTTFEMIDGDYYRDKRSVYWQGRMISGADPDTFELISGDMRYARDSAHEYYAGGRITIATASTSEQFLVSPFDGDEVTATQPKEIFWKRDTNSEKGDGVAIALVDEVGAIVWIENDPVENLGSYEWNPQIIDEDLQYSLIFYIHHPDGEVVKVSPSNRFTITEMGAPGVVISVDFQSGDVVTVPAGEVSYISWAASNVYSCSLKDSGSISNVGHSYIAFFEEGAESATDLLYSVQCSAYGGGTVSDEVKIKLALPPSEEK